MKKIKHWWQDHQWTVLGIIALVSLFCSYVGFREYTMDQGASRSFWDLLYLSLQLFIMESGAVAGTLNWKLEITRFLSPAIATYAAISAFTLIFREQIQLFKVRLFKDHIIICGLSNKGLLLSQGLLDNGYKVVIIELDEGNDLSAQCREKGALILTGDATDKEMLCKAGIKKAKYIISVCGNDGINTEVAVKSRSLVRNQKKRVLTCIAHIVDPELCHLLREREICTEQNDAFRLEFFNIFDNGAKVCLEEYPPFNNKDRSPHLLIAGAGRMGENLVVHASKKWKKLADKTNSKLYISIVDREAKNRVHLLYIKYPQLKTIAHLIPLQMDINSAEFQEAKFLFENSSCKFTSIYICFDNDSFGLSTALTLHQHLRHHTIPIIIRMIHDAGLATLLQGEKTDKDSFRRIHAFGLLDNTCTPALLISGTHERLARIIHEEYVKKMRKNGKIEKDNPSMVPWNKLPESLKESNRRQADHISIKLKKLGCGITPIKDWNEPLFEFEEEEIEKMAKLEHTRWTEERKNTGWKYSSGKKNIKKKTSPYLVPWTQLPEDIKDLDRDTVKNIPVLLSKAGFKVYRLNEKM